jgi:hypothetical protein
MYTGINSMATNPWLMLESDWPITALLLFKSSALPSKIQASIFSGLIFNKSEAQIVPSSRNWVNLSTNVGQASLKRLACEIKNAPNPKIAIKVMSRAITMAITLFILMRTKKFTMGFSKMAIMVEKIIGTTMPLATNSTANKAIRPIKIMDILTVFGYLKSVAIITSEFLIY